MTQKKPTKKQAISLPNEIHEQVVEYCRKNCLVIRSWVAKVVLEAMQKGSGK